MTLPTAEEVKEALDGIEKKIADLGVALSEHQARRDQVDDALASLLYILDRRFAKCGMRDEELQDARAALPIPDQYRSTRNGGIMSEPTRRDIQALILELTRERNAVQETIEQAEADKLGAFTSYERGKSYGLYVALNRLSTLDRRLESDHAR